jgi:hypothetical protein
MNLNFQRSWAIALALTALGIISAMPVAAAVAFSVTVNTSSVSGSSGFLDFQFNPGNATSQAATAQIVNFTAAGGSVTGVPSINGNVSGTLPGTLTFVNSTALNEYFQGFNYGTGFSFVLILSGPALDSPNGTATAGSLFCLGLYDSKQNPILTNQTQTTGAAGTVDINLNGTTTTTAFPSNANGGPPVVTFTPYTFQIRYTSNLNIADSFIDITNTGASSTAAQTQPVPNAQFNIDGSICVNIYAFAADEQEVSCCSCLVTPNGLYSLSVKNALANTVLTASVPNELVVKLISTVPTSTTDRSTGLITQTCNPATIGGAVASGLLAWGTSTHGSPAATGPNFQLTETPFLPGTLSVAEQARDVQECQFIQILGSGQFGLCKGCQNVGLGAAQQ